MILGADGLDVYTHPEFGELRVWWQEEPGYTGLVPFSFEADMFTPMAEVEALTRWMKGVRLDMSISVSGTEELRSEL